MSRDHSTPQIGDRFGRLEIIEGPFVVHCPTENYPFAKVKHVRCKCDRGSVVTRRVPSLRTGNTSSCGCLRRDMVAAKNTKHGLRKRSGGSPPEYFVWKQMRNRCNNPGDPHWGRYGGRGVSVCPRWDDFEKFMEDMGPRPSPQHSIDRIDNGGIYEPGNARWATVKEQARNKRNNVRVSFNGKECTVAELAEKCAIPYGVLLRRIHMGWSPDRAISEPSFLGKNQHGCKRIP